MNDWDNFLDGKDPSPKLVLEFLESKPASGWGEAITWLLTEHEYRVTLLEEALENQGLLRLGE